MSIFHNKIIYINLTNHEIKTKSFHENLIKKYLMGSGIAAFIMYNEFPIIDPLHPDSPFIIMSGLFNGTFIPGIGKTTFCARSPLTGIWNEATMGGRFGNMLKSTGYDGIVITGKSQNPVYIWINDEKVEIKDASFIWGKDTFQTDEILKNLTDPKALVATIGPAGEKLSLMSNIISEGYKSRAAGRGGIGAVMGSKNLKAIVIKGTKKVNVFSPEKLLDSIKQFVPSLKQNLTAMTKYGTPVGVEIYETVGDLPIKNFLMGSWEQGAIKISGPYMDTNPMLKVTHGSCGGCPVKCNKYVEIIEGPYKGVKGRGPEYETLAGFGSLCLNDNVESIIKINEICNKAGIDTISVAVTIAFAIECYDKGIITKKETQNIDLSWGNYESIITLVNQIINKEGFGEILSDGVKRASEKLGKETYEMALHHKGMEIPMHDPRAFLSTTANYATANRGACHLEALTHFVEMGLKIPEFGYTEPIDRRSQEGKAELGIKMQNYMSVFNPLGLCKFIARGGLTPTKLTEWLNLATGWEISTDELIKTGERIFNLKRLYNNRLGIGYKEDLNYPIRLQTHDRGSGAAAGILPDLKKQLDEYYKIRNWDKDGKPSKELLIKLELI